MFAGGYFPNSYFPQNYWPKVGGVKRGGGSKVGGRRLLAYYKQAEAERRERIVQHRENATALRAYLAKRAEEIEWHRKHREKRRQASMMAAFLSEL